MKITELDQKNKPHLYLDMDGVQADFFTAWAKWHADKFGMSHVERYKDIGSREQREQSIAELSAEGPEFIEEFFATLPVLPSFPALLSFLNQNNIEFTVLSAPLRGMNGPSIAGKRRWLNEHNPGTAGTAIFTGQKERYAVLNGQANVLVDDYKKYIQSWSDRGGIAVLHRDNNLEATLDRLRDIYKIQ